MRMREFRADLWLPAATQALVGWLLLVVVLLSGRVRSAGFCVRPLRRSCCLGYSLPS